MKITTYMMAALLAILWGIYRAFRTENDLQAMTLALTGSMSLAIGILAFPYHLLDSDLPIAIIQSIRSGISGIMMGTNGDIPYELDLDDTSFRLYRFFLYSLYVLGPIAGSMFLFSFSAKIRTVLALLFRKRFCVFSDLNAKSYLIAESIAETDRNRTILFCRSKNVDPVLLNKARSIRALTLEQADDRIRLHGNKKYEFFEMNQDAGLRVKDCARLCDSLLKQNGFRTENVIVRILTDEKQRELILNLDKQYGDQLYLRQIDEDNALAIEALSLCSDTLAVKKDCRVAVVADSDLAKPFLVHLLCLLIKPDGTGSIHLLGPKAGNIYASLRKNNPELGVYPVQVSDCSYDEEDEILMGDVRPDVVFVLYQDDERAYETAVQIRRALCCHDEALSCPQILCHIADGDLYRTIKEKDIRFFGNAERILCYDKLIHPDLEKAAERVHLSYLSSLNQTSLEDEARKEGVLKETGFYRFQNQESSFMEALALTYKQKYILSFKGDSALSDQEFIEEWLSDENNLQKMADAEHERWNAYERTHGWQRADEKQTAAIIRKYKGKRANDPDLKLHPALVSNEELAETEAMVNGLLKEYGTDYRIAYLDADRDIVKKITYILK